MTSKKSNKYALLDKNENEDQYEMIQMIDMDPSKKATYTKQRQSQNMCYVSLEDEVTKNTKGKKPTQQSTQPNNQKEIRPQNQPSSKPQQVQPQKQPVYNYPTYSANPNPTRIQMNGTNYRMQNAPQPKKSKVPQMKVACNFCTFQQQVPGNTQLFACCCCNNMNQCFPLYGLFICGYCQCKVCYPYGTSDMIRCTKCGTVNKVPLQPQKRYTNQPQKIQKKEGKKEQKKQEKIDFFAEQQIMEQADEPTRPQQKKEKQEEISFDDIPSLSELQQKQLDQNKYF